MALRQIDRSLVTYTEKHLALPAPADVTPTTEIAVGRAGIRFRCVKRSGEAAIFWAAVETSFGFDLLRPDKALKKATPAWDSFAIV